jgi:hypothetical protein
MTRSEARVIASGSLLLLALLGFGLAKLLERRTRSWPRTWATVHSTDMQVKELDEKTDITVPCFTFSYVVNQQPFTGRFSLFTDGEEEGNEVAGRMIDHRFEVQYNPRRPSAWYIPDKMMEGYEVEQRGSQHLHWKLDPSD